MPTNLLTPKQNKLRNIRNILWIVFSAITATLILVGSLSLPAALMINKTTSLAVLLTGETKLVLLSLIALMIVKIAVTGIICVVIYAIIKFRLDKEEDLFL